MKKKVVLWIIISLLVIGASVGGILLYLFRDDIEIPWFEDEPYEPDHVIGITTVGRGHDDMIRVSEDGTILFSPLIKELQEMVRLGMDLEDYQIELTFILIGSKGEDYWAYPTVTLPIAESESEDDWFDITLQSKDIDCGFCPTADRLYTVEVTVTKNGKDKMEGIWNYIRASEQLSESAFYAPTPIPTEEERSQISYTVNYVAEEGGIIEGESVQKWCIGTPAESVTAIPNEGYLFSGWSDGVITATRKNDCFVRNETVYARFSKDEISPGVANMYIETTSGQPITSRSRYVSATIRIAGAANEKYNVTLTTQIRGRGNSTFNAYVPTTHYDSKNSYRLKLAEKVNLLGVGGSSNRDWVLISNKFDISNLRNYFIWNVARQMQTISFVPGCTWVNVYFNGDFRGLYMLTELVEVANDRVEIDDSGTDPDKGYLLELDFRAENDFGAKEGLTYFYIPGFYDPDSDVKYPREWVIKSEVNSRQETAFIRDYMIQCHKAILNGDRDSIDALVDIPSLIDMFIIEELSRDVDVSATSQFWYKEKGGKLYFTAPWDFDAGFGTYSIAQYLEGFVCEENDYGNNPNPWLNALIQQKWFRWELYARMLEVNEMIKVAQKSMVSVAEMLAPSADRNNERWGVYGEKFHWFVYEEVSLKLKDYDAHVNFLIHWIDRRWEWMMREIWTRLPF